MHPLASNTPCSRSAPTDAAWKIFFKRVGLSKEQVFSDRELLLSTLQYSEVFASIETPPIGADGLVSIFLFSFLFIFVT